MIFHCPYCGLAVPMELDQFPLHCSCGRSFRDPRTVKGPGVLHSIANFYDASKRWREAGKPRRPEWEAEQYVALCSECQFYNGSICTHRDCGCGVKRAPLGLVRKLERATEKCPVGKWPVDYATLRPVRQHHKGEGFHLSGWPFAMQALRELHGADGLTFDDFVEQSFFEPRPPIYDRPWLAIFHHPPDELPNLIQRACFQMSLPHLAGAVALSDELAEHLREELPCQVFSLSHPIAPAGSRWSLEAWRRHPRVVQVGYHRRNTEAIYGFKLKNISKFRIMPDSGWQRAAADQREFEHYKAGIARACTAVQELEPLAPADYRELLASAVLLSDTEAAAACNVVLECRVHGTPLLIRRLPANVQYLGQHYPLFYDDLAEIPGLLNAPKLAQTTSYLKGLPYEPLSPERFKRAFVSALRDIALERKIRALRGQAAEGAKMAPVVS